MPDRFSPPRADRNQPAVCLISQEAPETIHHTLAERFPLFSLPPEEALPAPLRCHPDMLFSVMGDRLILARDYYSGHRALWDAIAQAGGFRFLLSDAPRGNAYPRDVAFNAAVGEDYLICHPTYTASEVLKAAAELGWQIHAVRQGYAACSVLCAGHRVLTSDPGIAKSLRDTDLEVFYADNEGILLPGYDVGFLGGCGGICGDTLYFTGNTDRLSSGSLIRAFANACGLTLCFLSDEAPLDIGGIRFLTQSSPVDSQPVSDILKEGHS